MSKRLVFISSKGGSGKTTLSIMCAVHAGDCLLVDCDPQGSAVGWYHSRDGKYDTPSASIARLSNVPKIHSSHEYVIVDTPPHADLGKALEGAYRVIIVGDYPLTTGK